MRLGALRIVAIYITLGILWITLSDRLLFLLEKKLDYSTFQVIGSSKGVFFVFITGFLLWRLIKYDDKRLVESEKQYRFMYEESLLPMWIYDLKTLRFLSVNKTAINSYGYSEGEFLQKTISAIRPAEDIPRLSEAVKNLPENINHSGIWVHKKADGTEIFVKILSQKIEFKNKGCAVVMAQDVNESVVLEQKLKQLNSDLQEKRKKLSETQQIAKVAGWEYYLENECMVWSDEMHVITSFGLQHHDNMFAAYMQHIHPEDKDQVIRSFMLLLKTGISMDITHRLVIGNGTVFYVRQLAKMEYLLDMPYKVVGSMQDITEFKLLEIERNKYYLNLEDTLNTISESFFTLNHSMVFTKVNARFEVETGFKAVDVVGQYFLDVFPQLNDNSTCSKFKKVLNGGKAVKFDEYDDALQKWLSFSAYPTKDGLAIYFQDISNKKRSEIQLEEALNRYDLVSKATKDVIYDYDIQNNKIVYNASIKQLVNCELNEINYNLNWWRSLIHPDDLQHVINSQEGVLAGKETNWWCEYRINCANNTFKYVYDQGYFVYNETGEPIRLIGAVKDIDDFKRTDEENRRLAEIITKVNNMVAVMDASSTITWVNKAFEDYTGFRFTDLIGLSSGEVLSNLKIEPDILLLIDERKSRFETFIIEVFHYLVHKGDQWLEIEYTPSYNHRGEFVGYIAVHQNITARKEKEERVNQQNKTLQEIAWLSSHEIRKPVASILGLIYLAKDVEASQDRVDIMDMINRCAEELDAIVHTISERVNEEVDLQ